MTIQNASRSNGAAPIIEITWEQRDLLRKEISRIASDPLENLRGSADRGHIFEEQAEYRLRAYVGMWLLDDIGWGLVDARESYYITVPPGPLASWVQWLREQVEWCLRDTAKNLSDPYDTWGRDRREGDASLAVEIREAREDCDRDLELLRVCDQLLAELERSV